MSDDPFPSDYYSETHGPTKESRQTVIDLCCAGFNQNEIAEYLDISANTLRKHYREELTKAKKQKTIALANNLYKDALNGDAKAREFWLCCQARWSKAKDKDDIDTAAAVESLKPLLEKIIDK